MKTWSDTQSFSASGEYDLNESNDWFCELELLASRECGLFSYDFAERQLPTIDAFGIYSFHLLLFAFSSASRLARLISRRDKYERKHNPYCLHIDRSAYIRKPQKSLNRRIYNVRKSFKREERRQRVFQRRSASPFGSRVWPDIDDLTSFAVSNPCACESTSDENNKEQVGPPSSGKGLDMEDGANSLWEKTGRVRTTSRSRLHSGI